MHRFSIHIPFFLLSLLAIVSCGSHKETIGSYGAKKGSVTVETSINLRNANRLQRRIVEEAMDWMGTPYGYGRSDKGEATDCSGMVLAVYRDVAGLMLPRNSAQQADFSSTVEKEEVTAGDLVFFATGKDADRISHVGIMLDCNRFIHASSTKGVVISSVLSPYYVRTFKKYGRII